MSDATNKTSFRPNWTHLLALIVGIVITFFYTSYIDTAPVGPGPAALCCAVSPDTVSQLGPNIAYVPEGVAKVAEEAYANDSTGFYYINIPF